MTKQVTVEIPENFLEMLGDNPAGEILEAAVLRWFEEGRLSQGQASVMLGMERGKFFDFLHQHRVSPIQMTIEDLEQDFKCG